MDGGKKLRLGEKLTKPHYIRDLSQRPPIKYERRSFN